MTTPKMLKFALISFSALILSSLLEAADDAGAIIQATKTYVKKEAGFTDVRVTVEEVADGFARVTVEGPSDPATAFLKLTKGKWKVLTLGTGFAPEDFTDLGIPASVQN